MNSRRQRSAKDFNAPQRESTPSLSLPSPYGGTQPVVVLNTPVANRFAGFSVISHELSTAREMFARAQAETDQLLISALWRAGVAIYARCFASTGSGMPKLEEDDHLTNTSSDLRDLHQRLMSIRHGFLSHAGQSDVERSSAQVVLSDPRVGLGVITLAASRRVTTVPPTEELAKIIRLIDLVHEHVQASLLAAHARALAEVHAMPITELYAQSQPPAGA